jgi:hypothetical protein
LPNLQNLTTAIKVLGIIITSAGLLWARSHAAVHARDMQ